MLPSELLDDAGRVDQRTTGGPIFDTYVTVAGRQSWHPEFTYHGFRYVEIHGLPDPGTEHPGTEHPGTATLTGLVLRAANAATGSFECSDELLNKVHAIIDRAVQSNMFSVLTDCPHREKLGWLEQLHLLFGVVSHGYDVAVPTDTLPAKPLRGRHGLSPRSPLRLLCLPSRHRNHGPFGLVKDLLARTSRGDTPGKCVPTATDHEYRTGNPKAVYLTGMLAGMNTTMKLDTELRDELASVASRDYGGVSLADALAALLKEHRHTLMARQVREGYAQLQRDPQAWADYQAELSSLDGLDEPDVSAAKEWPEYNH